MTSEQKTSKHNFIQLLAPLILMLFISACSSSGSDNSGNTPSIVTSGGVITKDTLVSFIRHYGKLNVNDKTLRGEVIINDTSKIKKILGSYYPLFLDKYTNRILKVPYEVFVSIGVDISEIAFSIKDNGDGSFTASTPTPIITVTGIYIHFDQEYRDIGLIRSDISDNEFNSAWQAANVAETIKNQITKERKEEFIDETVSDAVSNILNQVRNRYKSIEFKFNQEDKTPTFDELPKPIIK